MNDGQGSDGEAQQALPSYVTVVNPTDGSELSWLASRHAVALARATGAELVVAYVIDIGAAVRVGAYVTEAVQELWEAGKEITGRVVALAQQNGVKARPLIVEGKPGPTLVALLQDLNADLVVIGAKGVTSIARILLGSTAEHVLRHTPCPVFLVDHPARRT